MTDNTEALPPLPEHVATIGTDGHPRHLHHLWGVLEERYYGPPAPLFTADQMRDYARAAIAQRQQVPERVKYVPVDPRLRNQNWDHPNDDEKCSPECKQALNARGDDEDQGLDGYWKWGFKAGWNAHAALTVAPSAQAEPQEPLPEFLTTQDKADLLRIEDCFSDGEGYDLPRERMARLAELGVIRHNGGGVYSITAFGMYCTGAWPVLPLKTAAESNAEAGRLHAERMAHGIGKQEGK